MKSAFSCSKRMKRLRQMMSLLVSELLLYAVLNPAEGIKFQHPSFSTTSMADITLVHQDPWYDGQDASYEDSGIWLTPNPRDGNTSKYSNIGQVLYKNPIQFMNNHSAYPPINQVASFNTTFTFQIITPGPYNFCGSGMAFFISSSNKAPFNSHGRYLGLFSPNATNNPHFFAVEFDTHLTAELLDPSASHIGIDINSLISLKYTDTSPNSSSTLYPQLYLYNNYTFQAWIDYNSSTNLIQVWVTNPPSFQRPPRACLQLTYDLSSVFQESMYVGFSATNKAGEDCMEGHVVRAWSFTSEDFSQEPKHSKLIVPLAMTLSTILAAGAFGITLFLIKKRRRMRAAAVRLIARTHSDKSVIQLGSNHAILPCYSFKELKRSTQGFSNQSKIGEGGYSSVYRATLADGSIVAIKRLKESVRKEDEFYAEMNIISSIRHRNLLQLRGWCYEKGEAILVYKYMSNGSLESYLYGKKRGGLQSETRLKILAGVASALEYLHNNLGECVLHRDVKAANVLLTEGFEPMLSDFGLARLIRHDDGAVTMTAVGTPGYVAPETIYTGRATDKVDVYSFGVLMLEMAYGRPAMDRQCSAEEARLVDYAWMLHQRSHLMDSLDPCMCTDITPLQKEQWRCALHVALMCCNPWPESRPTMRQVLQALKGDTSLLMQALPEQRPLYPILANWPSASRSSASLTAWSSAISLSEACGSTSRTSKKHSSGGNSQLHDEEEEEGQLVAPAHGKFKTFSHNDSHILGLQQHHDLMQETEHP